MSTTNVNIPSPSKFNKKYTSDQNAKLEEIRRKKELPPGSLLGFRDKCLQVATFLNKKFSYIDVCETCSNDIHKNKEHICPPIVIPNDEINDDEINDNEINDDEIIIGEVIQDNELSRAIPIEDNTFTLLTKDDHEEEIITKLSELSISESIQNYKDIKNNSDKTEIDNINDILIIMLDPKIRKDSSIYQYHNDIDYVANILDIEDEIEEKINIMIDAVKERNISFIREIIESVNEYLKDTNIHNHFQYKKMNVWMLALTKLINNNHKNNKRNKELKKFNYVPIGNSKESQQHVYIFMVGSKKYKLSKHCGERYIELVDNAKLGCSNRQKTKEDLLTNSTCEIMETPRLHEHVNNKDGIVAGMERFNDNPNHPNYGVISYKEVITSNIITCVVSNCIDCETALKEWFIKYSIKTGLHADGKDKSSDEVFEVKGLMKLTEILEIIPKSKHNFINNIFDDIIKNGQTSKIIYDKLLKIIMDITGKKEYKQLELNTVKHDFLKTKNAFDFMSIAMNHNIEFKTELKDFTESVISELFKKIDNIYDTNDINSEELKQTKLLLDESESRIEVLLADKEVLESTIDNCYDNIELYSRANSKLIKIHLDKNMSKEQKEERIKSISQILISPNSTPNMISDSESDSDSE